jgi:hypothetical protein
MVKSVDLKEANIKNFGQFKKFWYYRKPYQRDRIKGKILDLFPQICIESD